MYITHEACPDMTLAHTDPTATVPLFHDKRGVHSTGNVEKHSIGGGGGGDRLDIFHHAADDARGGGRAYEHVCTHGGW